MPYSSLRQALCRALPDLVVHCSKVVGRCGPHNVGATPETYRLTASAPRAGGARDWRRSDAGAVVMQVRPLSVVFGSAGSFPFGCAPFGRSGRW